MPGYLYTTISERGTKKVKCAIKEYKEVYESVHQITSVGSAPACASSKSTRDPISEYYVGTMRSESLVTKLLKFWNLDM